MKILGEIKPLFAKYGYKKNGDSFWKLENGFYKLINFQKGRYGDYFFINVGLHPNGLPMLYTKQLCLSEKPKESECVLRQRAEHISSKANSFEKEIGYSEEIEVLQKLLPEIMPDIESWLNKWGSYETILSSDFNTISKLFSAAPIVWEKEFWLLKCYCALMAEDKAAAKGFFSTYQSQNPDMDFSLVDEYMENLIVSDKKC